MENNFGNVNALLEKLDIQLHEIDVYCIEIQSYLKGSRPTPLSKIKNEHLNKTLWKLNLKADFLKSRLKEIHRTLGIKTIKIVIEDYLKSESFTKKRVLH